MVVAFYFCNVPADVKMADGANGYAVAGNDDADTQGDYPWTVTNEGMDAVGEGLGIAVHAVVLLEKTATRADPA